MNQLCSRTYLTKTVYQCDCQWMESDRMKKSSFDRFYMGARERLYAYLCVCVRVCVCVRERAKNVYSDKTPPLNALKRDRDGFYVAIHQYDCSCVCVYLSLYIINLTLMDFDIFF